MKYFSGVFIALVLWACAGNQSAKFAAFPDPGDQCAILEKKRHAKVSRWKKPPMMQTHVTRSDRKYSSSQVVVPSAPIAPTVDAVFADEAERPVDVPEEAVAVSHESAALPQINKQESVHVEQTSSSTTSDSSHETLPKLERAAAPVPASHAGLIFVLSALVAGGLLVGKTSHAQRWSVWSARNVWKARGLLTLVHATAMGGAYLLGDTLAGYGMFMPDAYKYGALAAAVGATALYPFKNATNYASRSNYIRRKGSELVLCASGLMACAFAGDRYNLVPVQDSSQYRMVSAFQYEDNVGYVAADPKPVKSDFLKFLLTLLSIGAFALLMILLIYISCGIACSGAEIIALLVFGGGTFGAIWLLVITLSRIFKGRWRRAKKEPAPAGVSMV